MRSGAQHEVHNLVSEVFRVADPGWFLDFFKFRVQGFTVKQLAGIRVAILLILDPEVSVSDVPVEDVLAVFGIGFQIGGLDLFANELGVFRDQVAFQELQVAFSLLLWELFTFNLLFQHVEQMYRVGGHLRVVEVKDAERILNAKRVDRPFIPSSTPA